MQTSCTAPSMHRGRLCPPCRRRAGISSCTPGECGHAFLPDAPGACLKGLDRTQVTTSQYEDYIWNFGQTDAQYEGPRVVKDIKNGLADLASHAGFVKGWRSQLFAAPFGAWSNGENPWLDSYWDSQFDVIFTQQITTVDQAAAKEYHVRYRLELGEGTQSAPTS